MVCLFSVLCASTVRSLAQALKRFYPSLPHADESLTQANQEGFLKMKIS